MLNLTIIENSLIPVYQSDKGTRLVNMRELHAWLQVETRFNDWIIRRIEQYGFSENEDYTVLKNEYGENTGFQVKDYIFKLEPAKEIAMVESNEKGKEIRRYFIKIEDKFKQQNLDVTGLSPQTQLLLQLSQSIAKAELEQQRIERIAIEAKSGLEQAKTIISNIKDTMAELPKDQWRNWVNNSLGEIGIKLGNKGQNHEDLRSTSYKLLEERAGADLSTRVRNGKKRLEDAGATKTVIENHRKIDAIEEDKRLKEIYTSIVKELRIKHLD